MQNNKLNKERIEQAWEKCKDWITEFDGAVTEVFLADVQCDIFQSAIFKLSSMFHNFSTRLTWWDEVPDEQTENQLTLKQRLHKLIYREVANMDVLYIDKFPDFDFHVHIIVDMNDKNLVDLDVIWWSDEVFPEGVNEKERFFSIASHFIDLQNLFQSECLYLAPENMETPSPDCNHWMMV